jgi:hypothetical protein
VLGLDLARYGCVILMGMIFRSFKFWNISSLV